MRGRRNLMHLRTVARKDDKGHVVGVKMQTTARHVWGNAHGLHALGQTSSGGELTQPTSLVTARYRGHDVVGHQILRARCAVAGRLHRIDQDVFVSLLQLPKLIFDVSFLGEVVVVVPVDVVAVPADTAVADDKHDGLAEHAGLGFRKVVVLVEQRFVEMLAKLS